MSSSYKRYRSTPSEIEAVQFTDEDSYLAVQDLAGDKVRINPATGGVELLAGRDSAQGWVPVPAGHYVVRNPGDHTDYWPVEESYFKAKYREADGEEPFETRVLKLLENIHENTKPKFSSVWSGPK